MRGGTQWAPRLMLLRVRTQRSHGICLPPRARRGGCAQLGEESGGGREVFLDPRDVRVR